MSKSLRLPAREDEVVRYGDIEFDPLRLKVRRNGQIVPLSSMQMLLLRFFLEHPEVVFTRKQLLGAVWGKEDLTDSAVTACVMRIRQALVAAGGPDPFRSIPKLGYALDLERAK